MASDFAGGGWIVRGENDTIDSGILDFLHSYGSHGIVVDGVISWIDLQLDSVADNIWIAHAIASYSDEEVLNAKSVLWKACEKLIGETAPVRQGGNKKRSNIDDIVKALRKLKSCNTMPLILATGKMLRRAPLSSGISINANNGDIVQRVTLLENSLKDFMKHQSDQIKSLTDAIGSIGTSTATLSAAAARTPGFRNVNERNVVTPNKRRRTDAFPNTERPANDPSFASVAARHRATGSNVIPGISSLNGDASRPRRPSIMFGTSKTGKDDNTTQLLAADVALVASGVSRDASGEQLKEFLINKGISVVAVEKLTRDEVEARTNTFKVVIKLSDYEKAMRPEIWPYRVGVRHYKPPRRTGMSWQQQSRQSGAQINPQSQLGGQMPRLPQNAGLAVPQPQSGQSGALSSGQDGASGGSNGGPSPFTLPLQNRYSVLATVDQNGDVFLINN